MKKDYVSGSPDRVGRVLHPGGLTVILVEKIKRLGEKNVNLVEEKKEKKDQNILHVGQLLRNALMKGKVRHGAKNQKNKYYETHIRKIRC